MAAQNVRLVSPDACGQVNSISIRCMGTRKLFHPERKDCGFKITRIRVDGPKPHDQPRFQGFSLRNWEGREKPCE